MESSGSVWGTTEGWWWFRSGGRLEEEQTNRRATAFLDFIPSLLIVARHPVLLVRTGGFKTGFIMRSYHRFFPTNAVIAFLYNVSLH